MEPNGKKCVYIFKKGKSKGTQCNRVVSVETGDLCNKHFKETGGVYPDDTIASEPQDPPTQPPKKVKINVLKNEVYEIPPTPDDDTVILELPPVEEDIPEEPDQIQQKQEQEQEPSIPEDRQIELQILGYYHDMGPYLTEMLGPLEQLPMTAETLEEIKYTVGLYMTYNMSKLGYQAYVSSIEYMASSMGYHVKGLSQICINLPEANLNLKLIARKYHEEVKAYVSPETNLLLQPLVLIPLLQTQQSQDTETRSNEPQFKE
jgi:hypothetical protein